MSEILQLPDALLGIDVSHYQGVIDWPLVAESGVKFAFIKATDGLLGDPMAKANCAGARAAGVPFGFYHFWRPQERAGDQASNFLTTITAITSIEFAVALDIEVGSLTEEHQEAAFSWLSQVDEALQKPSRPLVYVSPSYAKINLTDSLWPSYPLWVAQYSDPQYSEQSQPNIGAWPKWTFWQRQANGTVPGITGPVDVDWFNGSAEDFQNFLKPPT